MYQDLLVQNLFMLNCNKKSTRNLISLYIFGKTGHYQAPRLIVTVWSILELTLLSTVVVLNDYCYYYL